MRTGVHPWIRESRYTIEEPASEEDVETLERLRESKNVDIQWLLEILDGTAVGHAQYEEDVDVLLSELGIEWIEGDEAPIQEALDKIAELKK